MNGKDLFLGMNYVQDKYIDEAETVTELKGEYKTISFRKAVLIAAVIALLAVTITACAYVIQRIRMNLVQHNVPAQTERIVLGNAQSEAAIPVNILTDCYPQSIPEGYHILCGEPLTYNSRNIQYTNETGHTITFWISTRSTDEEMVLRPPVEETTITFACGDGILKTNDGAQVLHWENEEDGYWANLFTDDVTIDLVPMAESVGYGKSIPMSVWYHNGAQWDPWYPQTLPAGYSCTDVTPVSNGKQIITYENGSTGYIRYCVSTLENFTPIQVSDETFWEETEVNGFTITILCNQDEQKLLFLESKEEGFYVFLETMDKTVDLVALAGSIAPGEKLEVSKSYLGPDYTIELEQEPATFIEWQSVYPQNIPAGYELEYVGDRAYGQQSMEWKNQDGDLISYTLYFRLGQYGREFEGTGEPEVVSINGHTGYKTEKSLLWADEELGFAYDLRATADVDLMALAQSVAPGPELPVTNGADTAKALKQLGDYRITALPDNMVEDGLTGSPLEQEDDWYSYVRRWYYDQTNNDQVYFTYETYRTDCTTEKEVLRLFVSGMTEPEFVTIHGHPGITLQDGSSAYVAWMDGDVSQGVSFQLFSEQFSVDALLKMAESIQKQ